ncbi:MAG: PD40 domain-containing protein [Steroidobacteraceae bacterium]|nr:PD40 domain-containing protein [Steroidobacteraceae bacterium]
MPVTIRERLIAPLAVAALAGCATGHDGDVNIGDGQNPDPVVLDIPVAYVRGPVPLPADLAAIDVRELGTVNEGSDLWLRDRAAPDVPERNITERVTGGLWSVRDVDASYDGARLLFSMRMPLIPGAEESEQPTWNVWEYDRTTDVLRRVIASDLVAEEGNDVAPHYLPDGRIVFTSTRQRQSKAVLIDEGKPQFAAQDEDRNEHAYVLHVMNADGSGIRQISFNQSHDLDPSVLDDGRIVFSRWENASGSSIHLYTVNPDGSGLELLYGANSHLTGTGANGAGTTPVQLLAPRQAETGRIVALIRPFRGTALGGDAVSIDAAAFVEITQPVLAHAGLQGPAQTRLTTVDVRTDPGLSPGGRYSHVYPLRDGTGRLLVNWTMCRLNDAVGRTLPCTAANLANPALTAAPPLYGVWLYDPRDLTQRPLLQPVEGVRYSDVVSMGPRTNLPAVILDAVPGIDYDPVLAAENVGILDIRSVYDLDGVDVAPGGIATLADPAQAVAGQRPARFLRVEKAVGIPDDEVRDFRATAFGVAGGLGMREILGYAPIEPDGSVRIKVPAGVPIAIGVLDADGRRITPRHLNWMQLRAGEVLSCNGCHVPAGAQPNAPPAVSHGRRGLTASVNPGAPTTGQPFPNSNPAIFADQGETMAEARARVSCQTDCAALRPSVDVFYDDVWTDPVAAGRAPDASFSYRYNQLQTPAPTSATCQSLWSSLCRITIHYPDHLHPLWSVPRPVFDMDGNEIADNACISCHSPLDADQVVRVPAGQLDLSGGPSPDQADHLVSYRELLFTDNAQEVNMGALQDILVPGPPDPVTGLPTLVPVPVPPSMSGAGARASARFFSRFDAGGSHEGWLTPSELRLIAEWLDIGGQYYNDPFMAPVN